MGEPYFVYPVPPEGGYGGPYKNTLVHPWDMKNPYTKTELKFVQYFLRYSSDGWTNVQTDRAKA